MCNLGIFVLKQQNYKTQKLHFGKHRQKYYILTMLPRLCLLHISIQYRLNWSKTSKPWKIRHPPQKVSHVFMFLKERRVKQKFLMALSLFVTRLITIYCQYPKSKGLPIKDQQVRYLKFKVL